MSKTETKEAEAEEFSFPVTVPSKLNDASGFPQSPDKTHTIHNNTYQTVGNDGGSVDPLTTPGNKKKKRELSPKKTVQMINRYTFRLYNCFKMQIIVLIVAFGVELFWPTWEIIAAMICGFFSLIIGWYGAHNRSICALQIFSVIETAGFLFSFFGTALIYWVLINYDDFCSSSATQNKNCIPKTVFLATAASSPVLFVLLLLGARYGHKLLILHKYLKDAFTKSKGYINAKNNYNSNKEKQALLLNDKNVLNHSINNNIVGNRDGDGNEDGNGDGNGTNVDTRILLNNRNDNDENNVIGSNASYERNTNLSNNGMNENLMGYNSNNNDSHYPNLRKNYHSNDTFKV